MKTKLTAKQERFVEEYLIDLNATQAAIRAGYSEKTATEMAAENLTKPHINGAIQARRQVISAKAERSTLDVLADIGRVRANCMKEVLNPDTGVIAMLAPREALKALELEGKHLGSFELDNRQKNPIGVFNAQLFFADLFKKPSIE